MNRHVVLPGTVPRDSPGHLRIRQTGVNRIPGCVYCDVVDRSDWEY